MTTFFLKVLVILNLGYYQTPTIQNFDFRNLLKYTLLTLCTKLKKDFQ